MAEKTKNKISKKTKIMIAILLIFVIFSGGALAARVVYLNFFADKSATVIVPDNLIGDNPASSDTSGGNEVSSQPAESVSSDETTSATESSSTPSNNTGVSNNNGNGNASNTQSKAAVIELYKGQPSDNEKFQVQNMLPGDTEVKYFAVKVSHHADAVVYFNAEVTEQTKNLGNVLHIKVTHLENGKVIYDGTFADMNIDGYGETFAATQKTETVAYYKIEVSLPTSTGNEYQAAKLMADFNWFVKDTGSLDKPPQTGDTSNIALWLAIMCGSLGILLILLFGKRREESEAE